MPTRVWQALVALIVVLLVAVLGLDQWQTRHGEVSLFGFPPRAAVAPLRSEPGRSSILERQPASMAAGPRVAIVVDEMGGRRDVFEALRELRRPLAVALLPGLPRTQAIARDASRSGTEVLLDLPMEPYRYPQLDPGPGALMVSMPRDEIRRVVGRHLE